MDRILHTNTEARKTDAVKILEWLVCAKRPMKWYEIQGALCINLSSQCSQGSDSEAHKCYATPKDLCASLVEYRKDRTVEFVHPTAKE
jgi:hypothetical protein